MQVVSYHSALYKKRMLQFLKVESCPNPTRSLDSPYSVHNNPHLHTKHRLNLLLHEYINTRLPLATLSAHALKLPPNHDRF